MMISPTTMTGISQAVLYQRLPMRTSGIRAMTGGIRRDHSARTMRSSAGLSSASRGSGALRGSGADAARAWSTLSLATGPSAGSLMRTSHSEEMVDTGAASAARGAVDPHHDRQPRHARVGRVY